MRKRLPCLRCGARVKLKRSGCPTCGKVLIRVLADRFEIRECLAFGSQEYSLRAWDRLEKRGVFVRAALGTAGPHVTNALTVEAQILLQSVDNPGVPAFIHGGQIRETGGIYLAQEFVTGESLDKAMARLPATRRIALIQHAVASVVSVHDAGYVHCAISFKHFIATPDGRVVLLDFRQTRRPDSRAGESGIPGYMAPEQLNALNPVTCATDTHALGACAYAALTGTTPFSKKRPKRLGARWPVPRKPSELSGEITDDLDSVVLRALAHDPVDRYLSAREFYQALCTSAGHETVIDGLPFSFPTRIRRALDITIAPAIVAARMVRACARVTANGVQWYGRVLAHLTGTRPITVHAITGCALILLSSFLAFVHVSTSEAAGGANSRGHPTRLSAEGSKATRIPEMTSPVLGQPISSPLTPTLGTIQFLTWPPSDVYVDGENIAEAPSPERIAMLSGEQHVLLVSTRGERRQLTFTVLPDHDYVLEYNFDTNELDLEEGPP